LIEDLRVFVKANGAKVSKVECDDSELSIFGCMVDAKLHGERVIELVTPGSKIVGSSGLSPQPLVPGSVAAVVVDRRLPHNRPLAADYVRSLLPPEWASHVDCETEGRATCETFRGVFGSEGTPESQLATVLPLVQKNGFRVGVAGCRDIDDDVHRCQLSAGRFLGENGADGVDLYASISQRSGEATRVIMFVSSGANSN
jgi:hypothetical protein